MTTGKLSTDTKKILRQKEVVGLREKARRRILRLKSIKPGSIKAQMPRRKKLIFESSFFLATLLTVLFCLSIVFRHPGWPTNHELLSFMERTAIYADHFKHGDIFPIWSSSDAFGEGSPLPLFYHKAFYYVAGMTYLLTHSMKATIVLTIAGFMFLGVYGIRFCVAKITSRPDVLLIIPPALLLTNYSFTDWLVRGAMAEFSAMMLVPWLLWWCLDLIKEGHFTYWIVPILFLLVEAHNVTALFALLLVAMAYVMFLFRTGKSGFRGTIKKALVSVAATGLLLAPQLILQRIYLADYDPSKITQLGFLASDNFKHPLEYIWDSNFVWLNDWRMMTVQLDFSLWIAVLAVLGVVALRLVKKRSLKSIPRMKDAHFVLLFLFLALLMYSVLQLKQSTIVYTHISPLQFLQFPWRLLAFVTPIAVLIATVGFSFVRQTWLRVVMLALWLLPLVAFSPVSHHFHFTFLAPASIHEQTSAGYPDVTGTGLAGIGEYYPRVYDDKGNELSGIATLNLYAQTYKLRQQTEVLQGACMLSRSPNRDLEVSSEDFRYACSTRSLVALPISYSRIMVITNLETGKKLGHMRKPQDPRTLVDLQKGSGVLRVYLPSTATAFRQLFD